MWEWTGKGVTLGCSWMADWKEREMGLGVLAGTHLKMEDRCIRLPETWKNKGLSLPQIQVDAEFLNSFLGSHTEMNMLDVISCKC